MYPMGYKAIQITFANEPNIEISHSIKSFCSMLEEVQITGLSEWVPSYLSVTIYFNPYMISYQDLKEHLVTLLGKNTSSTRTSKRVVYIPVCYQKEFAPDLEEIAKHHFIKKEEVIGLHTEALYYIYMLGFTPGFPYLGGLNKKIATPRKKTPRPEVIEGSVGIAGNQTGIYPLTSPGGWQIIGRTPLKLFNPNKEHPVLLRAGDYLKFESITYENYHKIKREVLHDHYQLKVVEEDLCENES